MYILELLQDIWINLYSLIGNVLSLIGVIAGYSVAAVIIYLLIIRPIWGAIFSKGNRLYWLGLIILLVYGFFLGPLMLLQLNDQYGTYGLVSGAALYVVIIYLIAYPGIKKENERSINK